MKRERRTDRKLNIQGFIEDAQAYDLNLDDNHLAILHSLTHAQLLAVKRWLARAHHAGYASTPR